MRLKWLGHQPYDHTFHRAEVRRSGRRPYERLLGGVWLGGLALAKTAWGARGTAFRGQWSLGSLIGSIAILGVLVALVLFLVWPRRGGQ
jgi:hypothetical protein